MTKQYRILERPTYDSESVFIAQRTRKFLWLIPYWSTYQQEDCGCNSDAEFQTYEQAKAYIVEDVKWEAWNGKNQDRVIALFQVDENGILMEVLCK